MGSRTAADDLARAEDARTHRQERYRSPLTFGTVKGALAFYSRQRLASSSAPTVTPRTTRRHTGFDCKGRSRWEDVRVSVDGSRGATREDVLAVLVTIHDAIRQVAAEDPGHWRAVDLTQIRGDPETGRLLTQKEAARKLNADQSTVSRWIGRMERGLLAPLKSAGVVV